MAVWRFVNLNIPEARLLADLASQAADLEATVLLCDIALAEFSKESFVWGLLEALTSAAVVRYSRCFASGVRTKFPSSLLDGLSDIQKKDHEFFIDLRNKYIAHSVNAFEENEIVAYLVPEERGPRGVASIEVQRSSLSSLGSKDFDRLKALSSELNRQLGILIDEEKRKVLVAARKLPINGLYSQVDSPKKVAGDSDITNPRRQH